MTTTTRKTRKLTPEQVAADERYAARLANLRKAITEGRAYLETYIGRRTVVAYHNDSGQAVTNNAGRYEDQRSFIVSSGDIKIAL